MLISVRVVLGFVVLFTDKGGSASVDVKRGYTSTHTQPAKSEQKNERLSEAEGRVGGAEGRVGGGLVEGEIEMEERGRRRKARRLA